MSQPSSWQDLRDRFLAMVSQPEPDEDAPPRWLAVWHLLIEHPWYREQLSAAAGSVLRGGGYSLQWREDIEHDAILLLARQLRKAPDLYVDPLRAERHFAGWMRTITGRACKDALRQLRRKSTTDIPSPELLPAREQRAGRDALIDLAEALEQFDEKTRAVLLLHSKGLAFRRIATELELSHWDVFSTYHKGLEKLGRRLDPPERS